MYKDGLHLIRSGKSQLSNNFMENIIFFIFLEMHTQNPYVPIHIPLV